MLINPFQKLALDYIYIFDVLRISCMALDRSTVSQCN